MPVIATLRLANDGCWIGTMRRVSANAKVGLVPNDNRHGESAPAFHLIFSNACISETSKARSAGESPNNYLLVKLGDPALIAPMSAALFRSEDGTTAQLVWSRRDGARD